MSDLLEVEADVQLFNGQKWRLEKDKGFRYTTLFDNGKPQKIYFASEKTEKLFSEIKILFDKKGCIVAQRINRNCRLLTTRENKWFYVQKNTNHKKGLEVYTLISGIEVNELRKRTKAQDAYK